MKTNGRRAVAAAALLLASCSRLNPNLEVSDAWARAVAPGQNSTAIYMTIRNRGGAADRLQAVSTAAGTASVHKTSMTNGVMRMRTVKQLEIPAGGAVEMKPGGVHVMVMGISQPLSAGAKLPVTLRFEKSGERQVEADVKALGDGM